MGIPFTLPMGFLFTATLAFLFTMTLGFQLTISSGTYTRWNDGARDSQFGQRQASSIIASGRTISPFYTTHPKRRRALIYQ
jgi:hypothetical protein